MFNEMQDVNNTLPNPQDCSSECGPPLVITGPTSACGTVTYSAPSFAGASYSWTTSPAGAFSPATGTGPTFTTTAIGPANAQVAVSVNSPCPNTSFNASVPVAACAPFEVAITNLVYTSACFSSSGRNNNAQWTGQASGGTGPYTYSWYVDYAANTGGNFQGQFAGSGPVFSLCMNNRTYVTVQVRATDATGQTVSSYEYYGQNQGRGTNDVLYPNPADGYVEVASEIPDPALPTLQPANAQRSTPSEPIQVTVYNGQGLVVLRSNSIMAARLHLDTRAWQSGLYQVVVRQGKTQTRRQLSVQY
ncbi:T9SS type A sorting domain-containing protein [Hymenobacter sp.]|jgi:hypothetical protein|uniref:T9SS type A sorting domain-containing protein n=1 Tax=Hymenobacter sp. TaxID=1898978 RepID=UPI002ED87618